jgi:hypothetical protein
MREKRAVGDQRYAGGAAHGVLKRRIPACVLAGVEIGESVQIAVVGRPIVQQVRNAEVNTAAAREHLIRNAGLHGIGIGFRRRILFGERHVHLHGPARADRVAVGEKGTAQRHRTDEILVDVAQFLLRLGAVDAIAVAAPSRRLELQNAMHHHPWYAGVCRPIIDLPPRDRRQAGYHRIRAESRFLLDHRDHRADVFLCGDDGEGVEGREHIGRPPGPIRDDGAGQRTFDQIARLRGTRGGRAVAPPLAGASRNQCRKTEQHPQCSGAATPAVCHFQRWCMS